MEKRSKLTKRYHSNPTANDKKALDFQAKEYTSLIIESKERFIAKMSGKLDNPKTGQSQINFKAIKNSYYTTCPC